MSEDTHPDGPTKEPAPDAKLRGLHYPWRPVCHFYVIRQLRPEQGDADPRNWCIVDAAGANATVTDRMKPPIGGHDPHDARPDEQRAAMEASADERTDYAQRISPDGHVLFLAVSKAELLDMGLGPLVGRAPRRKEPVA